ncbi:unnamed protein product [Schistosoma mattheei]|uniref:Uncharacterized protein n=1 Tax=Schistosoma mattheei TaxID=31246 RepID=A0AA85B5M0_9TREM|nr:unnamed protein product [Schistosoma mattheei]
MADRLTRVINLASKVSAFVIQETSPRLIKFREYARVELRPPTQADLKPAVEQATKLICAFKSGAWKNVSVKGLLHFVAVVRKNTFKSLTRNDLEIYYVQMEPTTGELFVAYQYKRLLRVASQFG